uniref:Secreted protein n=1 Tax=Echinococcus granulosus TaxID=6210 RepID=A0A068WV51_ECHGR|nr:hypothetical protein EgrG_000106700 [Echinococcus granulosus]
MMGGTTLQLSTRRSASPWQLDAMWRRKNAPHLQPSLLLLLLLYQLSSTAFHSNVTLVEEKCWNTLAKCFTLLPSEVTVIADAVFKAPARPNTQPNAQLGHNA